MSATDLTPQQASDVTKVTGADANGKETNFVDATVNRDIQSDDTTRAAGLDTTVTLAGAAQEVKVGASRLTTRKYVMILPTVNGVKWGLTAGTQSFDVFKNQLLILPFGPNTPIYINGTGVVEIGEV